MIRESQDNLESNRSGKGGRNSNQGFGYKDAHRFVLRTLIKGIKGKKKNRLGKE